MAQKNYYQGQIDGSQFNINENILDKIEESGYHFKKIGISAHYPTLVEINGKEIWIDKFEIYEANNLDVYNLTFKSYVDHDTIVDYIIIKNNNSGGGTVM